MSKVYLAASSLEIARVRRCQRALANAGHVLALDWLTPILDNAAVGKLDASLPDDEAALHAWTDLEAVRTADVLWLLAPEQQTRGAWVELGFAIAMGKLTIVSGPAMRCSIFARCATHMVDRDESVLALLPFGGPRLPEAA